VGAGLGDGVGSVGVGAGLGDGEGSVGVGAGLGDGVGSVGVGAGLGDGVGSVVVGAGLGPVLVDVPADVLTTVLAVVLWHAVVQLWWYAAKPSATKAVSCSPSSLALQPHSASQKQTQPTPNTDPAACSGWQYCWPLVAGWMPCPTACCHISSQPAAQPPRSVVVAPTWPVYGSAIEMRRAGVVRFGW